MVGRKTEIARANLKKKKKERKKEKKTRREGSCALL
jgi:hypothetical protein